MFSFQRATAPLASANLFDRLRRHVDEFEMLRKCSDGASLPWQDSPAGERLKIQARSLAVDAAVLPGVCGNPLLCDAQRRITRYWKSRWSCGFVSDLAYRVALKSIMVYIMERPAWPYFCLEPRDSERVA